MPGSTLTADQNKLVAQMAPLVKRIAYHFMARLPASVHVDDLIQAGLLGLLDAAKNFDDTQGAQFETYAIQRIRGSILDELRRQDHVPRSIRRKTREISAARESLMRATGRAPEDREIAAQLGIDLDTLWRWQSEIEGAHHVPLDRAPGDREATAPTPSETLSNEAEPGVEDALNHEQEVRILREAILKLKEQERVVLSLYYFEELKLHEIATVLDLTETRVSQIRTKALGKLRGELLPLRERVA